MLKIKGLTRRFQGRDRELKVALENFDLQMDSGEFALIVGGAGAGKSTLLQLLSGRILPDGGRIMLDHQDITVWPEYCRSSIIATIWGNTGDGAIDELTVAENLSLASIRNSGVGAGRLVTHARLNQLTDYLEEFNHGFNLNNHLNVPAGELVWTRRLALEVMMAGISRPQLLLLDDPTSKLSPDNAEKLLMLIVHLINAYHLTAIMTTPSSHWGASLGTRLLAMYRGRIIADYGGKERKHVGAAMLEEKFATAIQLERFDFSSASMLEKLYI